MLKALVPLQPWNHVSTKKKIAKLKASEYAKINLKWSKNNSSASVNLPSGFWRASATSVSIATLKASLLVKLNPLSGLFGVQWLSGLKVWM